MSPKTQEDPDWEPDVEDDDDEEEEEEDDDEVELEAEDELYDPSPAPGAPKEPSLQELLRAPQHQGIKTARFVCGQRKSELSLHAGIRLTRIRTEAYLSSPARFGADIAYATTKACANDGDVRVVLLTEFGGADVETSFEKALKEGKYPRHTLVVVAFVGRMTRRGRQGFKDLVKVASDKGVYLALAHLGHARNRIYNGHLQPLYFINADAITDGPIKFEGERMPDSEVCDKALEEAEHAQRFHEAMQLATLLNNARKAARKAVKDDAGKKIAGLFARALAAVVGREKWAALVRTSEGVNPKYLKSQLSDLRKLLIDSLSAGEATGVLPAIELPQTSASEEAALERVREKHPEIKYLLSVSPERHGRCEDVGDAARKKGVALLSLFCGGGKGMWGAIDAAMQTMSGLKATLGIDTLGTPALDKEYNDYVRKIVAQGLLDGKPALLLLSLTGAEEGVVKAIDLDLSTLGRVRSFVANWPHRARIAHDSLKVHAEAVEKARVEAVEQEVQAQNAERAAILEVGEAFAKAGYGEAGVAAAKEAEAAAAAASSKAPPPKQVPPPQTVPEPSAGSTGSNVWRLERVQKVTLYAANLALKAARGQVAGGGSG